MSRRRFVNLVVSKRWGGHPAFNLHRIDPAGLFSPTRSPKPADPAATKKSPASSRAPALARLPPAAISFDEPCSYKNQSGWMDFMALKDDIVGVDQWGHTVLYDGAVGGIRAMNTMVDPRRSSISLTVGDGLYSLDHSPPHKLAYFHALTYGRSFGRCLPEDWYWRPLPPPPLDYDRYERDPTSPGYHDPETHPCAIGAYTVVRDSQIWMSTVGAGTYSFDTARGAWSKVGEWALPFKGHARYVPELGLWFGFAESDGQLCAADLALGSSTTPPVKQGSWEELAVPGGWDLKASHLVPLGSGKLCVVRFFLVYKRCRPPSYRSAEDIAVLTGVEFDSTAGAGPLRMIKHRSKRYRFGDDEDVKLV
ncbi:unnamed protein product [Alopecurus aequalis]